MGEIQYWIKLCAKTKYEIFLFSTVVSWLYNILSIRKLAQGLGFRIFLRGTRIPTGAVNLQLILNPVFNQHWGWLGMGLSYTFIFNVIFSLFQFPLKQLFQIRRIVQPESWILPVNSNILQFVSLIHTWYRQGHRTLLFLPLSLYST